MLKLISVIPVIALLSACGTAANFTRGMEEPVAVLKKASGIAEEAEADILKSYAIGILNEPVVSPGEAADALKSVVVCRPWMGPSTVVKNLTVFTDSVDTVKKVGEAPADTSYRGYIRKFRENAAAAAPVDAVKEQADADTKAEKAAASCASLFLTDAADGSTLRSFTAPGQGALPVLIGKILALDGLIKGVLAQAEAAQREAAVRRTVEYLIPQLSAASDALKSPVSPSFGPVVNYGPGAASAAVDMNKSVLGATITIRRWHVAKQLKEQWAYLKPCRDTKPFACLADPLQQQVVTSFATNVRVYRSLSAVDPRTVEKSLQASIEAAKGSLKSGGIAGVIDALIGFSDSVKGLSDAYDAYDKSKD